MTEKVLKNRDLMIKEEDRNRVVRLVVTNTPTPMWVWKATFDAIPDDCQIVQTFTDPNTLKTTLMLWSLKFNVVAEGAIPPAYNAVIDSVLKTVKMNLPEPDFDFGEALGKIE